MNISGYYSTQRKANAVLRAFTQKEQAVTNANKVDPCLKGLIDATLDDFVAQGKMFTAFDVTGVVRTAIGTATHVFHEVVKQYVHDRWEDGMTTFGRDYARTTIPIASPPPWCYYIPGIHDPSNYAGGADNVQATVAPDKISRPTTTGGNRHGERTKPIMATFGGFRHSG